MKLTCPNCGMVLEGTREELTGLGECMFCGFKPPMDPYKYNELLKEKLRTGFGAFPDGPPAHYDNDILPELPRKLPEPEPKKLPYYSVPHLNNRFKGNGYRAIRVAHGLTLKQLEAKFKVSRAALARFERDDPGLKTVYVEMLTRKYAELAKEGKA